MKMFSTLKKSWLIKLYTTRIVLQKRTIWNIQIARME